MLIDGGLTLDSPRGLVEVTYNSVITPVDFFIMDKGRRALALMLAGKSTPVLIESAIGCGGYITNYITDYAHCPNLPLASSTKLEMELQRAPATLVDISDSLTKRFLSNFIIATDREYRYVTELGLFFSDGSIFAKAIIDPSKLLIPVSALDNVSVLWHVNFS
jgi:hypothetical protein